MTRHQARRSAFMLVFQIPANAADTAEMFARSEGGDIEQDDFCRTLVTLTVENLAAVDDAIRPHLNRWTLERLPRVSLAVLRISVAQLLFMQPANFEDLPTGAIIDEAVELAKEFGADDEYAFVNGALRSITQSMPPTE